MKKALSGIITLAILVFVFTSGLIEPISKFFIWLVTLNMTQSSVSIAGEIFVKVATFVITYTAVGALFNAIGWFDSDIMKIVYFIISTLVSFALCWLVMIFETHLLLISIIAGVLLAAAIALFIFFAIRTRKSK